MNATNLNVILRVAKLLTKRQKRKLILSLLIQAFLSFVDLLAVGLLGVLGSIIFNGAGQIPPGNRVSQLLIFLNLEQSTLRVQATVIGLLAGSLLILKTIVSIYFVRKMVFFLSRTSAALSSKLFSQVVGQDLMALRRFSMHETLHRVTNGIDAAVMGVLNTALLVISDSILLVVLLSGLFIVELEIALISLFLFTILSIVLYAILHKKALQIGKTQNQLQVKNSQTILEIFQSYREIFVKDRRSFYSSKVANLRMELAEVNAQRAFLPNISKYILEVSVVLSALLISALQFAMNSSSRAASVLSVFLAASTRISPALLRLQQGALAIKGNIGNVIPTLDLIDQITAQDSSNCTLPEEKAHTFNYSGFIPQITMKNLNFEYQIDSGFSIENLSLNIEPGSFVAIVGSSGAGKSTLVDLLLGVLKPDSGEITISGMLPQHCLRTWPGGIGYVPQTTFMVDGSVRENLTLGYEESEIPDSNIWRALEIADLDNFVRSQPDSLETYIGENGTKLSGGQRQRIGIARAMVSDPKMIIFDEATSSLDGETEKRITDTLLKLKGKVTLILIAHRLSTVIHADKVIYLQEGSILARGTFGEVRELVSDFDYQARLLGL